MTRERVSQFSLRRIRWPSLSYADPAVYEKYAGPRKEGARVGGARVIYYNRLDNGEIWLLTIYAKADRSTIPAYELKLIKEVIDRD
jgi:hypothetical protein